MCYEPLSGVFLSSPYAITGGDHMELATFKAETFRPQELRWEMRGLVPSPSRPESGKRRDGRSTSSPGASLSASRPHPQSLLFWGSELTACWTAPPVSWMGLPYLTRVRRLSGGIVVSLPPSRTDCSWTTGAARERMVAFLQSLRHLYLPSPSSPSASQSR